MTINLKRFAAVISPRWREPATCEACGNTFTCGATLSGCWCSEIKLSAEQRAELKERYRDCLCGDCLERIASGSQEIDRPDVTLATSDSK